LSAFILARSEPSSSYLFSLSPPSDPTIPFPYGLLSFILYLPNFPPNSYCPLVISHARCPPLKVYFMVILLSFLFSQSPPWGSRSRVTKVRILHAFLFTLYSMGRPSAKSSKIFQSFASLSSTLIFFPLCPFLSLPLSLDRAVKLNSRSCFVRLARSGFFSSFSWIGLLVLLVRLITDLYNTSCFVSLPLVGISLAVITFPCTPFGLL
jgi:hypothetical protein